MQKNCSFDFYLIKSNPHQPDIPRVFFTKKQSNKILWSLEIDEIYDAILDNEFDLEEAEHFGTILRIENNIVIVRTIAGEQELSFSEKLLWQIETLLLENNGFVKIGNKIWVARPINRHKYKNDVSVDEAEKNHLREQRLRAEGRSKRDNLKLELFAESDEERVYAKQKKKKRG